MSTHWDRNIDLLTRLDGHFHGNSVDSRQIVTAHSEQVGRRRPRVATLVAEPPNFNELDTRQNLGAVFDGDVTHEAGEEIFVSHLPLELVELLAHLVHLPRLLAALHSLPAERTVVPKRPMRSERTMRSERSVRTKRRGNWPAESVRWWRASVVMHSATAGTSGEATSPRCAVNRSQMDPENMRWVVESILGGLAARAEVVVVAVFTLESSADNGMHIAFRTHNAHVDGNLRNGLHIFVRVLRICFRSLLPLIPVSLRRPRTFGAALTLRGQILIVDEAIDANAMNGRSNFQERMRRVVHTLLLAV
mmetsp:Transcript_24171/g.41570  ORF Transcript_24171/g.41570 Transcript_24171/m.41570 type:complete len:306 (+) Transcript_24171:1108-2025(+)